MKTLKNLLWLSATLFFITSCNKEEIIEKTAEIIDGKVPVNTEIVVDGVVQTNTRAASEAGYTTGDGLYDSGDPVTVAAVANEGYELAAFYDKADPSTNLGTSFDFKAKEPRVFKAEFAKKYTITVSASPTDGGNVSGGGKYRSGKTCTLTATANAGYLFDGWYEGSTKLSSNASYSFTVSSNRTITGKFAVIPNFIAVGYDGFISTSYDAINWETPKQVGENHWKSIAYGNGKYVVVGSDGYVSMSNDGESWTTPKVITKYTIHRIIYANGMFLAVGGNSPNDDAYIAKSKDGITWDISHSGRYEWNDIIYCNGKYIVVGDTGYLSMSDDGESWTPSNLPTTEPITCIAYGNGKYVTTGKYGNISSSPNCIDWTKQRVGSDGYSWNSIAYGNGKFVAVGFNGKVATSTDGLSWSVKYISKYTLTSVVFSSGKFIVVGTFGDITTSADGINWKNPIRLYKGDGGTVTWSGIGDIY